MTEQLLTATAPVFEIDGEVRGELARDLVRLEVEETTAGLKTLTARFLAQGPRPGLPDEGLLLLDGHTIDFGKKLAVSIGPGANARTVFTGYVSGLEASFREGAVPEVTVFAEDDLMKLRMTRRMKTYENVSDADIARAVAAEHSLGAQADADGPTYDVVQQWNQSDLAFLRDRAAKVRAEIWCHDGTLYFQTRDKRTASELTLIQGNQLLDVQLRADLAHQRATVAVGGYDAPARDAIDEEAAQDAIDAEVTGGRTGTAVLKRAFSAFASYRVREAPIKGAEATAWARSEFLRRARGFVTAVGTTRGSPDMVVGSRLTLDRVGDPFDGPGYYTTRVRHTYDLRDGHRTHFAAERPTIGGGT
jgi:uncharacterized protein